VNAVTEMDSTTETAVHYVADTRASQFTVQVFAGGLLSAFGHNPTIAIRGFAGEARVNPADVARSYFKITIQADSLSVRDDISDKDRREIERTMREDVLETSAYPEIVYECSQFDGSATGEGQYSVMLNGDLTLHGVTRPQPVAAKVAVIGDTLRAFGSFTILQTDYDLTLVNIAGGALKVKDELKFSFNILARKKE
jgi:polyisoprenoid-binding protein YceI